MRYKVGILSTHPVQYYTPWYQELARRPEIDLTVYYSRRATAEDQAAAGFGVAFEWDVPLLSGYRYRFLDSGSPGKNGDASEIACIMERERFHGFVVHGWYTRNYWQAIRACWRTGTPVMVRGDSTLLVAGGRVKKLVKWFTHRRFIPRFDVYLVVGSRAREYYLAYGADPGRMEPCPHFVDNKWFAKAAATASRCRDEIRRGWGLGPDEIVFLFVGKFLPLKRPMDFIRAVSLVRAKGLNAAGLMVGDGPLRTAIEVEIRSTRARVQLAGFLNQSAIPRAYAAADVLVLASQTESWGLVVNEAMACGLPAVVSDRVGCAADLVTDGETGFVYPCGDVTALAAHLIRLAGDANLRTRLAAAARKRIKGYSVQAAADGLCRAVAQVSACRLPG